VRLLLIILITSCFHTQSFTQTFISSDQQWVQYYSQIDINKKSRLGFDAGFRWKNEFSDPSQFIVRISGWRKLNTKLSVGAGIAHSGYFNSGTISTFELRPHQELLFLHKYNRSNIQFRYKLEERFYSDQIENESNQHRFVLRNRLVFSYTFFLARPFKKYENTTLSLFIGDELFVNIKTNNTVLWFDQNRVLVGPILKFNQKFSMQFLYNLQLAPMSIKNNFRVTNVFWLSFRHTLDFSKAETIE